MVKKLKYLLFLFTFLLIIDVNAWTLSTPYVNYEFANSGFPSGAYGTEATYFNTQFYVSPFLLGGVDYSDYVKSVYFSYYNTGFCANQDISISGTLLGTGYQSSNKLFNDESVSIVIKNNGVALSCVLNNVNGELMNYQCYGKGGGDYNLEFHLNSYHSPAQYTVGISKDVSITCDASNLDVISNATANTNAIINNQNGNTQVIINNQDSNTNQIIQDNQQNTQDIIDNQNENTQDIIDNQNETFGNSCYSNLFNKENEISGYFINANGSIVQDDGFSYSGLIEVEQSTYRLSGISGTEGQSSYNKRIHGYDANGNWVAQIAYSTVAANRPFTFTFTVNNPLIKYVRLSLLESDTNVMLTKGESQLSYLPYGEKKCINKLDEQTNAINGLNDTLNDTSQPNTNDDIDDMNDMVASDTPISDLITMPLTLVNAYINGVSSSCSPYNLGNLYGTNLILPCINLEQRLGSNLWRIIDALFCLFMCYNIGMLFVTAFDGITSLRDDFEGLYQPRHADTGYQPKHGGGS